MRTARAQGEVPCAAQRQVSATTCRQTNRGITMQKMTTDEFVAYCLEHNLSHPEEIKAALGMFEVRDEEEAAMEDKSYRRWLTHATSPSFAIMRRRITGCTPRMTGRLSCTGNTSSHTTSCRLGRMNQFKCSPRSEESWYWGTARTGTASSLSRF